MNCLVINNPNSGRCKSTKELDYIKEKLLSKYDQVDIINTTERKEAIEISEENSANYHTYVIIGGDGTYSEVLQGIVDKEKKPIIGYIPTGTTNDFAKCCNIPVNVKDAVEVILKGKSVVRSTMFVNGKVATYVVTAGMLTSTSYTTPQRNKKKLGKLAYYIEVLLKDKCRGGAFLKVVGDKVHDAKFTIIACLHGLAVGGFHVNKKFNHNDSTFKIVMIKRGTTFWGYLVSLYHLAKTMILKLDKVKQNKHIVIEELSKIVIKAKDQNTVWNVDGEKGPSGDIEVTIKPNQYEAIVG